MGAGAWARHGSLGTIACELVARSLQDSEWSRICRELEVSQHIGEPGSAIKLPGGICFTFYLRGGEHCCILRRSLEEVVEDFGADALTLRWGQDMYLGELCVGMQYAGDFCAGVSVKNQAACDLPIPPCVRGTAKGEADSDATLA